MVRNSLLCSRLLVLPNLPSMLYPAFVHHLENQLKTVTCITMCVCAFIIGLRWYVRVQMGTHRRGRNTGQRGVSPTITLCLIFWRQCLSLNLSLAGSTRSAGQKGPGIIFLCLLPQGTAVPRILHGCWGSELRPFVCTLSTFPVVPSPHLGHQLKIHMMEKCHPWDLALLVLGRSLPFWATQQG